ncbi:hypothetical protein ACS0TY_008031 [Phlomoides rotata]
MLLMELLCLYRIGSTNGKGGILWECIQDYSTPVLHQGECWFVLIYSLARLFAAFLWHLSNRMAVLCRLSGGCDGPYIVKDIKRI